MPSLHSSSRHRIHARPNSILTAWCTTSSRQNYPTTTESGPPIQGPSGPGGNPFLSARHRLCPSTLQHKLGGYRKKYVALGCQPPPHHASDSTLMSRTPG